MPYYPDFICQKCMASVTIVDAKLDNSRFNYEGREHALENPKIEHVLCPEIGGD